MDERKEVIILCLIFLVIGAIAFYLTIFFTDFNFYKTKLDINSNIIKETLYYKANKPYHTLYRNFETPITVKYVEDYVSRSQDGYIQISSRAEEQDYSGELDEKFYRSLRSLRN